MPAEEVTIYIFQISAELMRKFKNFAVPAEEVIPFSNSGCAYTTRSNVGYPFDC